MRASFSQGQNDAGVVNARMGHYCGDTYLFTHRNPSNGKVWGENIPVLDSKEGLLNWESGFLLIR